MARYARELIGIILIGAASCGERAEQVGDDVLDIATALAAKHGLEFDRAYVNAMVTAHQQTLQLLEHASDATTTPALDSAIVRSRATVQDHLGRARHLRDALER